MIALIIPIISGWDNSRWRAEAWVFYSICQGWQIGDRTGCRCWVRFPAGSSSTGGAALPPAKGSLQCFLGFAYAQTLLTSSPHFE